MQHGHREGAGVPWGAEGQAPRHPSTERLWGLLQWSWHCPGSEVTVPGGPHPWGWSGGLGRPLLWSPRSHRAGPRQGAGLFVMSSCGSRARRVWAVVKCSLTDTQNLVRPGEAAVLGGFKTGFNEHILGKDWTKLVGWWADLWDSASESGSLIQILVLLEQNSSSLQLHLGVSKDTGCKVKKWIEYW